MPLYFCAFADDQCIVAGALRLKSDLERRNHEVWFDQARLTPAQTWNATSKNAAQFAKLLDASNMITWIFRAPIRGH